MTMQIYWGYLYHTWVFFFPSPHPNFGPLDQEVELPLLIVLLDPNKICQIPHTTLFISIVNPNEPMNPTLVA